MCWGGNVRKGEPVMQISPLSPSHALLPSPTILHLSLHTSQEPLTLHPAPTDPISLVTGMKLSHSGTCRPTQNIQSWEEHERCSPPSSSQPSQLFPLIAPQIQLGGGSDGCRHSMLGFSMRGGAEILSFCADLHPQLPRMRVFQSMPLVC